MIGLEKQTNMISNLPVSTKCASYLINVKKLIRDHNIESNEHNLYKMKTQNNITKQQTSGNKEAEHVRAENPNKPYEPTKE